MRLRSRGLNGLLRICHSREEANVNRDTQCHDRHYGQDYCYLTTQRLLGPDSSPKPLHDH